jgi:small-conductance mechanosensitive channel
MPKLKGILVSLAKMGLWLILIIVVANNLGFNNLAVAISGSVLILAFILNNGLAPLVSDIMSGVFLCTDPDFRPGCVVKLGKGKDGITARIVEVDMRKVRLIDEKGQRHIFPNSVVDKAEWAVVESPQSPSLVKSKAAAVKEVLKKRINGKSK